LRNPNADLGSEHWRAVGQATIEEYEGDKVFVVRNGCSGNSFFQDVKLTASDHGKYVLLIGRGSSERVNADGAITGLPYLYGYMLKDDYPRGGIINTYLQVEKMLARPSRENERVTMYGIFRVPENTVAVRFFLQQAERSGVPQNGSAARFDNLGLFLFDSEKDALKFVITYK
jgi:hypothetical protein